MAYTMKNVDDIQNVRVNGDFQRKYNSIWNWFRWISYENGWKMRKEWAFNDEKEIAMCVCVVLLWHPTECGIDFFFIFDTKSYELIGIVISSFLRSFRIMHLKFLLVIRCLCAYEWFFFPFAFIVCYQEHLRRAPFYKFFIFFWFHCVKLALPIIFHNLNS